LLWSEYAPLENAVSLNQVKDIFDTGKVKNFGENKLHSFLASNKLNMMIRGGDCIQEGFDKNHSNTLINIFSVPDYGGKY
jgi:hypothetical protein